MPRRDRSRPFWSKWVWKDWDAKTRDLSAHEYTAYHRLLSYAATCSEDMCSIPDDDIRLARATGLGLKRWRSVRERVLDYFLKVDSRWVHDRLREDATRFLQLVENAPSRGTIPLPLMGTTMYPTRAGVRSKKLELELEDSKEEERKAPPHHATAPTGPSARCLARCKEKFPQLDIELIEAKLMTYHERNPFKKLDMAMLNWCKKARDGGFDLLHSNYLASNGSGTAQAPVNIHDWPLPSASHGRRPPGYVRAPISDQWIPAADRPEWERIARSSGRTNLNEP